MKPIIIALTGPAGCGKDTVAQIMARQLNASQEYICELEALAFPMKQFCMRLFGWNYDRLYGPSELRNKPDPDGLTPRKALQTLGTEWGRALREDVWVDALLSRIERDAARWLITYVSVVTDLRFPNEAKKIREAGGYVIRITGRSGDVGNAHESEQHFSDPVLLEHVTHEIDNSGTLDDLREKTLAILAEILKAT